MRKAHGDSPQDRLYIITIPGQGYSFVAQAKEAETDSLATISEEEQQVFLDRSACLFLSSRDTENLSQALLRKLVPLDLYGFIAALL